MRYQELAHTAQQQLRTRVQDAGPGDGWLYEIDKHGRVWCRHRDPAAARHNALRHYRQQLEALRA